VKEHVLETNAATRFQSQPFRLPAAAGAVIGCIGAQCGNVIFADARICFSASSVCPPMSCSANLRMSTNFRKTQLSLGLVARTPLPWIWTLPILMRLQSMIKYAPKTEMRDLPWQVLSA
jgi:hypothetical protein